MNNINLKKALERKNQMKDLVKSIANGQKTRTEIESICVSLVENQVKDETALKGFWPIIIDDCMPSDATVDFIHYPTYYATMIMMHGYLMNLHENIFDFEKTLSLGMTACKKVKLSGHGYESTSVRLEVLDLFVKLGLLDFLSVNYDFCEPFSNMVDEIFEDIKFRKATNSTKGAWGEDYTMNFENLLKQSENHQLKLFVYGTLMKEESNHRFLKNNCVIGDAVASGYTLYDTGHGYPAVKHSSEGDVSGELYLISEDDLKQIDYLEDNGDMYTREFTIVTDKKGCKHLALIYVYNYEVDEDKQIPVWKTKNEYPEYIWYASYGSNLNYDRFMRYIDGCENKALPVDSKPIAINHRMYFSQESSWWDYQGVAFIDPEENQNEKTLGRMYLITREQFEDIKYQEGAWYQNELNLGMYDNKKIVTFTDFEIKEENEPCERYLEVIKNGILQTYPNMTELEAKKYLKNHIAETIQ